MFENVERCPVCGENQFTQLYTINDHSVSREDFSLVSCNSCQFLFTNPRPTVDHIHKYYASNDYISHQNKATNPINWAYRIARHFTLNWKKGIVERYQRPGSALDIGCGTGHFLNILSKHDWHVTGIEPDETARSNAKREIPKASIYRTLEELPDTQTFDLITLWHVLEHVHDLNSYIDTIKTRLKLTGTLIIAVPNYKSYDAKYYQGHWAAYDVPRHLYHFTQDSMSRLLTSHHFQISDTLPMILDAYYVSLLSEKYRGTGLLGISKSIITAYKSNNYAKKSSGDHSSLIFVGRHYTP